MRTTGRLFSALLTAFTVGLLGVLYAPAAQAADAVSVLGTVRGGTAELVGATVEFCEWDEGDEEYRCAGPETTSDDHGVIELAAAELEPGVRYAVRYSHEGYWPAWWGSGLNDPSSADAITVPADAATDIELGEVTLQTQYLLVGKVVDANDVPLADMSAGIYSDTEAFEDGDPVESDSTDGDGAFRIAIPPTANASEYVFGIYDDDREIESLQPVVLGQQAADLGAISVDGSALSVVTGLVVDDAGTPLPSVSVSSRVWSEEAGWDYYDSTETSSTGHYSLLVRPGGRFTVRFDGSQYLSEFLGGGRQQPQSSEDPNSTRLANGAGEVNPVLPDAVLERTHPVIGKLVTTTGPVANALIRAYPANHAADADIVARDWSIDTGNFTLRLPSGRYDLVIYTDDAEPRVIGTTLVDQAVTGETDLGEITLEPAGEPNLVSGKVISASGPVSGAQVTAWVWHASDNNDDDGDEGPALRSAPSIIETSDEGYWVRGDRVNTAADGSYSVSVSDQSVFTVQARYRGFQIGWLGSVITQPASPGANTSARSVPGLNVGEITLFPSTAKIGKVAGQDLDYCNTNVLAANDDESTEAVQLPFELRFYGQAYDSVFVNNNGNVSFGQALSQYTPGDLTSDDQAAPMVAAFFADVDTRGAASWEVSYGSSPDGKTFCANWAPVGYFAQRADKLNVFQVLLTTRSEDAGRSDGDFDIALNYDQIEWETGSASGGGDGFGGISAAVGYTAGTGEAGTFFEFDGSRVPGSFLDNGPLALIKHQLNSSQAGRYRFEIRNADATVHLGGARGTLNSAEDNSPIPGASVSACRLVDGQVTRCAYTISGTDGRFSFPALPEGSYRIEVSAPEPFQATAVLASVASGVVAELGQVRLTQPEPMPSGTSLTNVGSTAGVPVVYWGEPLVLRVPNPCVSASPTGTWKVLDADGTVIHQGSLSADGSNLGAKIPQLYPHHGAGRVETEVLCGVDRTAVSFDIYIDPSGTVYDQYGLPADGAKVTLQRADTADGDFATLPSGSTMMSVSNRENPVTTGDDGNFHWDVAPGWYRVAVSKASCAAVTGPKMQVPPERVELVVKLACTSAPQPTRALAISGGTGVGATLTATPAEFAKALPTVGYRWTRDGVVIGTGSTRVVVADDQGHTLTVEQTLQAEPVDDPLGSAQVTFAPLKLSASVTVPAAPSQPATSPAPVPALGTLSGSVPTVSGKPTVKSKLTAKVGAWGTAGVSLGYQWLRGGVPIPGATGTTYKVQAADGGSRLTFRVTGTKAGYNSLAKDSAPTKMVPWSKLKSATPKVKGKPSVGGTLQVRTGKWTASTTFGYQWLRAGKVIPGASTASYVLTAADLGKAIKVKVTGTKQGYKTVAKTSKGTKKVR